MTTYSSIVTALTSVTLPLTFMSCFSISLVTIPHISDNVTNVREATMLIWRAFELLIFYIEILRRVTLITILESDQNLSGKFLESIWKFNSFPMIPDRLGLVMISDKDELYLMQSPTKSAVSHVMNHDLCGILKL